VFSIIKERSLLLLVYNIISYY